MEAAIFKIVSSTASALVGKIVEPKISGAHLVDDPVRLGSFVRWTWRRRDVAEKDVKRLVRELLLRAGDADPEVRAIDPNDGQRLIDALVATVLSLDAVSVEVVQAAHLGPENLASRLEDASALQEYELTPPTRPLFHTTLRLCCVHVIEHFTRMPEFLARSTVQIVRDIGYIKDLLDGGHELHTWTNTDILAGLATDENIHDIDPIEPGERVDVALLRQGRLPNLQQDFAGLTSSFDKWVARGPQRKRGPERLRLFWLVGDPGPHRSKGLLACLSRAGVNGRIIHDAGKDVGLTAKALDRATFGTALQPAPLIGPLISVDLRSNQSKDDWVALTNVISRARTQLSGRGRTALELIDPYPRIIVAGTAEQSSDAYEALEALTEITPIHTRGVPWERPDPDHGNRMVSRTLTKEHVYNQGLPVTARELFGREHELSLLRQAWESDRTRVMSVVAYGGTGKSALVNSWLRQMRDDDYLGARRVFAWSFYSQGTKENLVSADPFINSALAWLGESTFPPSPVERGIRLASLIKERRFLLVLDGVEPLQHPMSAPNVAGQFTDDSMRALLVELAKPAKPNWKGLCVVTTRVPLTDLRRFEGSANSGNRGFLQLLLENLDDEAAAALLRTLAQTNASFRDLQPVVQEVDGHALAVTLLGNYIRDVHNGNLAGRFDLEKLTLDAREGGHARRIMESYVRWLRDNQRIAELSVLNVIGLFDRPAPSKAMEALLAGTDLEPFTDALDSVGGHVWNRCVDALRGMGLLNNEIPDWPGVLDAHPLVREHFRDELRRSGERGWQKGNHTLYTYYRGQAIPQPDSRKGMDALYAAVAHGCAAELHQEVFDEILLQRVWRDRRTSYSTRRLGMTGSDLVALSNYFQHRRWTELQERPLSPRARVLIMTNTGVRLRQLGRLPDARQCFGAVVNEIDARPADAEELQDASYVAAQYCELLVIAGKLRGAEGDNESALVNGQKAIDYSDRGHEAYFRMHSRSSLAEAFFMLGDLKRAKTLFDEAQEIDRDHGPVPPFLYSQSLFRYGYYMIETGRAEQIVQAARMDPSWGTNGDDSSLLSRAIRLLILGAARRSLIGRGEGDQVLLHEADESLKEALNEFRGSGYSDYTVRGLLERAHFSRLRGSPEDYESALEALDEASFEAARGQMDLLHADVFLQKAACYLKFWATMTNEERAAIEVELCSALSRAATLVRDINYWRRREMLDELEQKASSYGISI